MIWCVHCGRRIADCRHLPPPIMTTPPPLTRAQALALEPRLRAILSATYALQSGWRDSHGVPLRTAPPTQAAIAAELRALADALESPGAAPERVGPLS
jgi:hypothetical protein